MLIYDMVLPFSSEIFYIIFFEKNFLFSSKISFQSSILPLTLFRVPVTATDFTKIETRMIKTMEFSQFFAQKLYAT